MARYRRQLTGVLMVAAIAALPATSAAQSDPDDGRIAVGPTLSTLGLGAEIGFRLGQGLVLRINGNYLSASTDAVYDGVHYELDVDLASVGALVDYHPFGNGLLVSAGVYWNGNGGELRATPTTDVVIGGTTYSPAQVGTLRGEVSYNTVAPYLGVGYDGAFTQSGSVSFNIRLGLYYMGRADVRLSADGALAGTGPFEAELRREEENLERDLDVLGFYPALTIGLKYRF